MKLAKFFKRQDPKPSTASFAETSGDETGPVQQARTRARRRLIGAVVLLAVGVVVFPVLFETKPRPLPADVPIEVQGRRDVPAARTAAPAAQARPASAVLELPVEPAASVPAPLPAPVPAPVASVAEPAKAEPVKAELTKVEAPKAEPAKAEPAKADPRKPEPIKVEATKPEAAKADTGKADPAKAASRAADGERARALLEGKPEGPGAADARPGRFVVQVGAFTDAAKLREVRAQVEKLGLKTYTQTVETASGARTRVRVGPFNTRAEAESAGTKLKAAGLPGNVLVL